MSAKLLRVVDRIRCLLTGGHDYLISYRPGTRNPYLACTNCGKCTAGWAIRTSGTPVALQGGQTPVTGNWGNAFDTRRAAGTYLRAVSQHSTRACTGGHDYQRAVLGGRRGH